jgi:hypothetical protein
MHTMNKLLLLAGNTIGPGGELDIEKEMFFQDIDEKLYLRGRLDMYDYKTQTIIDLKVTNAIKWQYSNHLIPRERDCSVMVLCLIRKSGWQICIL